MSTETLIKELQQKETNVCHVKQLAYGHVDLETNETYQVQVIVTRDHDEFLEPFDIEEMRNYKH